MSSGVSDDAGAGAGGEPGDGGDVCGAGPEAPRLALIANHTRPKVSPTKTSIQKKMPKSQNQWMGTTDMFLRHQDSASLTA